MNNAFSRLEQDFQREPTSEEIAIALDMVPKDVKEALKASTRHVSMDAPLKKDEENTLYDVISATDSDSPDSHLIDDSLRKEIERSLATLSTRESDIVKLYYGLIV